MSVTDYVTYSQIYDFLAGPVAITLREFISDYIGKIHTLENEKNCWMERVVNVISDEYRDDLSPKGAWYSPDSYNSLDVQACCQIILNSNYWNNDKKKYWNTSKNSVDENSITKIYNLNSYDSRKLNSELISNKIRDFTNIRRSRNFIGHPENGKSKQKMEEYDLVCFVDSIKRFVKLLPIDKIDGLEFPIEQMLLELHMMWKTLPDGTRKRTNWNVEDLIPNDERKGREQEVGELISMDNEYQQEQKPTPKPFVPTQTHGIDDTKTRPQPKSPMRVNRENPQLILFLVDESKSMAEYLENQNGKPITRGEVVVQKMTKALFDMVEDCQVDGEDKNYYYVSLLGYCGSDNSKPEDLYDWAADADAELKNAAIRPLLIMNDFRKDKWMKYSPIGRTPMKPAFERAFELIKEWDNLKENYSEEELEKLSKERRKEILATSQLISKENNGMWTFREMNRGGCHPPIIINISDGRFDNKMYGEKPDLTFSPEKVIQNMKNYQYKNFSEPPVVMNLYISSGDDKQTLEFPDKRPSGDDEYLKHMFDISSTLSQNMLTCAREYPEYSQLPNSARALIYNADSVGLETILRIGTIGTRMGITETAESRDDPGY